MSITHSSRVALLASLAVASMLVVAMAACGDVPDGAGTPPAASPPSSSADASGPQLDAASEASSDAAAPSDGCPARSGYPMGTSTATVTVGSAQRTFRVHVPPNYDPQKPAPIVLVLHGGGGSGLQIETQSAKMDPIADREGFITAYPDGTGVLKTWNGGLCCGKAVENDVDDVSFMKALLDDLQAKLCSDKRRVFATGMSNGAIMSHRLACELSDRIAAIAPVAGTIGVATCQPTSKVAVMEIHGTSDGHVPWDGGFGCGPSTVDFAAVPATVEGWRTRNGCSPSTTTYFQQGDGKCTGYQDCESPVVLCTIAGGGHSWPGGEPKPSDGGVIDCPADGFQSETFIASEAIWAFFKANPKPQ